MNKNVLYKKATNEDIEEIDKLITKYLGTIGHIDFNLNETATDEYIFNKNYPLIKQIINDFYVAVDEEKVVGLCAVSENDYADDFYEVNIHNYKVIAAIVVDKEYRGMDIGNKLLKKCVEDNKKDIIICEAWGDNGLYANASRVLEKNQFKLIKNMGEHYYENRGDCPLCVNRRKCNKELCTAHIYCRMPD